MKKTKSDPIPASAPSPVARHWPSQRLQTIRDNALREQLSKQKTIAELEALSSEIEATLAFLKAHRAR